jgi:hypothetical protein
VASDPDEDDAASGPNGVARGFDEVEQRAQRLDAH